MRKRRAIDQEAEKVETEEQMDGASETDEADPIETESFEEELPLPEGPPAALQEQDHPSAR